MSRSAPFELRLSRGDVALDLADLRLDRAAVEREQEIALLDPRAVLEMHADDLGVDARLDRRRWRSVVTVPSASSRTGTVFLDGRGDGDRHRCAGRRGSLRRGLLRRGAIPAKRACQTRQGEPATTPTTTFVSSSSCCQARDQSRPPASPSCRHRGSDRALVCTCFSILRRPACTSVKLQNTGSPLANPFGLPGSRACWLMSALPAPSTRDAACASPPGTSIRSSSGSKI